MGRDSIISKWGLIWITPQIKREMKRRAAAESVIDHLKAEHRIGRNHLAHSSGDAINAVLAVGYNFRLLLKWLRLLLLKILIALAVSLHSVLLENSVLHGLLRNSICDIYSR
jgi:IS5 family transposase